MAVTAPEVCHQLLYQLRLSNLNFVISETPYSAQILLRKRFLKDVEGPACPNLTNQFSNSKNLEDENKVIKEEKNDLVDKVRELESSRKTATETLHLLEEKIAKAEAAALKCYQEKNHEVATFKTVVKNHNDELARLKADLSQANRSLKEKDKELFRLDQKCDNLSNNMNKYKTEVSHLKAEKIQLEKEVKKSRKTKKSVNASTNTLPISMPTSTISSLAVSKLSPVSLCSMGMDCSPTTNVSTTVIAVSTTSTHPTNPPVPSSRNTPCPKTSTLSFTDSSRTSMEGAFLSTSALNSPTASTKSCSCSHTPQCMVRHPNPPPPFAPITFNQFYNPPKPPTHIKIFPDERLTYDEYLNLIVSHKCEEFGERMLYHTERVEYDDPGPCGGVEATYMSTCPNHTKASIVLENISEEKNLKLKKQNFKCEICSVAFTKESSVTFHVNRKHFKMKT